MLPVNRLLQGTQYLLGLIDFCMSIANQPFFAVPADAENQPAYATTPGQNAGAEAVL